jgi:hypothetical protein
MSKRAWIVLLVSISFKIYASASDGTVCTSLQLSQEVAVPVSVGTLGTLVFTEQKTFSEATVPFTNSSSSRVDAIFALIELFSDGDRVMTLPLSTRTKPDPGHDLPIALSALQERKIRQPVDAASTVTLYGYNPKTMRVCPSRAVLSYFLVSYADGHAFTHSLANWYSDAVPYRIPNAPGRLLRGSPINVMITIGVDPEGHVQVVEADSLNQQQQSDVRQLTESWLFLPAVDAGRKVKTSVRVLLANEGCKQAPRPPDGDSNWLTVTVCPRGDTSQDQEVYVGGFLQ